MSKDMPLEKEEELLTNKIHYFETHALPFQLHHMQMRSTGLQVFTAIQGGLLVGWATKQHPALIFLGLGSALSFALWDARNRDIFRIIRRFGVEYVDKKVFGEDFDGKPNDGINKILLEEINKSGKAWPGKRFVSHTWAIRALIILSFLIWGTIGFFNLCKLVCGSVS